MIALLCPTRGRPEQFKRMCESVKSTSTANVIHEIVSGTNAGSGAHYCRYDGIFPEDTPTVFMWNMLAGKAHPDTKLFMLAADDMIFSTPGWDEALLDHYSKLENKIHCYHLQDSRDKNGVPHPILTREWIEAMGWFVPPYFLHWEIDVWTNEIAKANNCFTHLRDFELIHDKCNDRGRPDQTHLRIRQNGWRERDAYVAKSCSYLLEYEKQRLAEKMK
jgi:hypothetical protein